MRRLLALAAVAAVFTLTACNPPPLISGGWAWDPTPAHPITVDNRWGVPDLGTLYRWNDAAGTTVFAAYGRGDPNGINADVVFQSDPGPMYRNGDPAQGRIQMWVQRIYSGAYVSHCIIHFDYTYNPGHFTDPNWQAAYWWGPDDRAMLARDGYGP